MERNELFPNESLWMRARIYLAGHRKAINENLGLIIALLAAAFAGWSGWEAREARKDALLGLKDTTRSYVEAEDNTISGAMVLGSPYLNAHFSIKVYGNTPAFQIKVLANCQLGPAGVLLNKPGGITKDDFIIKPAPPLKPRAVEALLLPGVTVPGNPVSLDVHCIPPATQDDDIGVAEYGEIVYKDVFSDPHYSHFCYFNPTLIHEAVASQDTKKWNENALNAGKHLIPCSVYNDAN